MIYGREHGRTGEMVARVLATVALAIMMLGSPTQATACEEDLKVTAVSVGEQAQLKVQAPGDPWRGS